MVGILERVSLFEEEEDCTEHFQNTTGFGIRVKLAILDLMMKVMVEQTERTARKAITLSF